MRMLNSSQWLMEPEAAEGYRPLIEKVINGDKFAWKDDDNDKASDGKPKYTHEAKAVYITASLVDPRFTKLERAVPGSIAVIPLQDVVMQEDYCGAPGLNTLRGWMTSAEGNANIIGQIILTDSPGGSSQGVDDFGKFIKGLKKPVVSFVEGSACSAAYWIPSATREIICADKHSVLGSIGAFSTFYDSKGAREQRGYREIQVYAPQSTRKNKIFQDITSTDDATAKKGKAEFANRFLKPLVDDFIATVKTNRPGIDEEVLSGDIYNGTEALANKLADHIGDFNFAIKRVQELAKSNTV